MAVGGFGALLRQWRTERGLSLGGASLRAGISKAALSRWESGSRLPSVVELDAVFDALGVTEAERVGALRLLDVPRSVRRMRDGNGGVGPPVGGDLLRALRVRRGLTQAKASALVGVRQGTLAKWEKSNDWPAADRGVALATALGASDEETAALAAGRFLPLPFAPALLGDTDRLLRVAAERLELLHARIGEGDVFPGDLYFLSLEAALWSAAGRSPTALRVQADVAALHGVYLSREMRPVSEILPLAERAEDLGRRAGALAAPTPAVVIAAVLKAQATARRPHRFAPAQALRLLRPYAGRTATILENPDLRAWVLWEAALSAARVGDADAALRLAGEASTVDGGETGPDRRRAPWEAYYAAAVSLAAGRPQDALDALPHTPSKDPYARVRLSLVAAQANVALNCTGPARVHLDAAEAVIDALGLAGFRPLAQKVRSSLSAV